LETSGEMRRFERLSVGPEYRVTMEFQGRELKDVVLQNISAGGCGVKVPRPEAAGMDSGVHIPLLHLIHPALPHVPLEATVVRLLGRANGSRDGYVLLGLEFAYVTPTVERLIQRHVIAQKNPVST